MFGVLDLFCGTGGFSHGLTSVGQFRVLLGIDLLDVASETFRANHPAANVVAGDIRKARAERVAEWFNLQPRNVDVIVGGPPCQGFSSIRPFRSSEDEDERNSLFIDFCRYTEIFRPSVVVMENVVGLATHEAGSTLNQIQTHLHEIGYDSDWKILNAAHFGVPQKRERLILVAVARGGKIVFPTPTHDYFGSTIGVKDKSRMLAPEKLDLFNFHRVEKLPPAVTTWEAISDLCPLAAGEESDEYAGVPMNEFQDEMRKYTASNSLSLHSSTKHTDRMLEIIRHSGRNKSSIPGELITSGFSSSYSRLDPHEPAVTLTVNFVHPASNRCIHPYQDRALTAREGARLQSFPDHFRFEGTRTQVVRQIGNAVPPLLGAAIGRAVTQMLGAGASVSQTACALPGEGPSSGPVQSDGSRAVDEFGAP